MNTTPLQARINTLGWESTHLVQDLHETCDRDQVRAVLAEIIELDNRYFALCAYATRTASRSEGYWA
jgi:hypothetical protein